MASAASLADMDGADLELQDRTGIASHKLMLRCARKLRVTRRETIKVGAQTVEAKISEVMTRQDQLEQWMAADNTKAVQSRQRHQARIRSLQSGRAR